MRRFAGACRFVYNKALALQKERHERGEKKLGYAWLFKLLTADVVGAINILSRGMQLLRDEGQDTADASVGMRAAWLPVSARMACGSNRTGGRKQEPTETTAHGFIHA